MNDHISKLVSKASDELGDILNKQGCVYLIQSHLEVLLREYRKDLTEHIKEYSYSNNINNLSREKLVELIYSFGEKKRVWDDNKRMIEACEKNIEKVVVRA